MILTRRREGRMHGTTDGQTDHYRASATLWRGPNNSRYYSIKFLFQPQSGMEGQTDRQGDSYIHPKLVCWGWGYKKLTFIHSKRTICFIENMFCTITRHNFFIKRGPKVTEGLFIAKKRPISQWFLFPSSTGTNMKKRRLIIEFNVPA